jgi:hypothetical protein
VYQLLLSTPSAIATYVNTRICSVFVCNDGAAVNQHASEATLAHRLQRLSTGAEHNNAAVAGVGDDEVVEGRDRDSARPHQHTHTHVADEVAVHAEHAHAVADAVSNCDVKVTKT